MAGEDPDYTGWVRLRACLLAPICGVTSGCHAHHAGRRATGGKSSRAHDHTAIPLCARHHAELHALCGAFAGMDRAALLAWSADAIARTRERYTRWLAASPEFPF